MDPANLILLMLQELVKNSLQELVRSKQRVQEVYESENRYGPNVSQFEGDIPRCVYEVQQIKNPTIAATSSGKKKKSTIDKHFAQRISQGTQPSIKSALAGKEAIWRVDMTVERFFYDAYILINEVNSFYFKPMLDVIVAISPGYKDLSYHHLRVNLSKDSKKEVQLLVNFYCEV